MAKISKEQGPSYAGVIPDERPTTEQYEDAQERVARGKPEDGDGALISRYESAAARSVADQHAEPVEIGERVSGDATLKASDPDAQLETADPETGQPRLADDGDPEPDETATPGVGEPPKDKPASAPKTRGRN